MIASESNRVQSSTTASQAYPSEAAAEQHLPEQLVSVSIRDPFWFMSLVAAGRNHCFHVGAERFIFVRSRIIGRRTDVHVAGSRHRSGIGVPNAGNGRHCLGAHVPFRGTREFPRQDRIF